MNAQSAKKLFAKLNSDVPMALDEGGMVMCFSKNLSNDELAQAFELFHLAYKIETRDGFYLRAAFERAGLAKRFDSSCPAGRVTAAIAGAMKPVTQVIG